MNSSLFDRHVSSFFYFEKTNYTPSPLPYPPRSFSFCRQVQTIFKETESHVIYFNLKLILKISAFEEVPCIAPIEEEEKYNDRGHHVSGRAEKQPS